MRKLLQQEVMLGNERQRRIARRNQHIDVSVLDEVAKRLNELRILVRQAVGSTNRFGVECAFSIEKECDFYWHINLMKRARDCDCDPRRRAQNQYRIVFRVRVHLTSLNVLFVGLHQFNRCRLNFYSA